MSDSSVQLHPAHADERIAQKSWGMLGPQQNQINLNEYLRILRRHWLIIVLLTAIGGFFGWYKAAKETPIYRAGLTMLVEQDFSSVVSKSGTIVFAGGLRFYETQYELLRSRVLAERVVDKLGLVHRKSVKNGSKKHQGFNLLNELFGVQQEKDTKPSSEIQVASPEWERAKREGLVANIRNGVTVRGGNNTQLVYVHFDSPDPAFAAEVANTLVDAYIELGLESRLDRAKRVSAWLTERIGDLRKKVSKSEEELQQYQTKEGMVDLKNIQSLTGGKLSVLNRELGSAQKSYTELSRRYGHKHPKLIAAKTELDIARRRVDEVSRTVVGARRKEFELAKHEREVAANRQLYDVFLDKFKETDLATERQLSNARVIDRAKPPKAPFYPNEARITSMWGFIGLLLGVLIVFVRENLDNTFKTNTQIEDKLNLPVLGVMPLIGKKRIARKPRRRRKRKDADIGDSVEPERYFISESRSAFAEAVNHIRTGILYSNVDDPPKIILVTSAIQAEGKTTLATNLALSFSQLGRTLLIDADLRKPRVQQITQVLSKGGMVEYVAGSRNLQECVVNDPDSQDLFVLKSGTVPPNPLELLSSKKLEKTLKDLKEKFSHIVIDTAPILPVSDAIVLGHIVDAVLLVVQAERTTYNMVQDGLRRLNSANISPLGVVLSQVSFHKSTYYYDGRYQYYYGGYYGQAETRKAS